MHDEDDGVAVRQTYGSWKIGFRLEIHVVQDARVAAARRNLVERPAAGAEDDRPVRRQAPPVPPTGALGRVQTTTASPPATGAFQSLAVAEESPTNASSWDQKG
jgi:hypothetical protein